MTIKTFCQNLKRLWACSLAKDYKAHYVRWNDSNDEARVARNKLGTLECDVIIHSRNIETLLNRANGDEIDALTVRLENLRDEALSIVNKHRTLIAYLVKDVEDLKNAKPGEEPRRTETPITISINVDGVPVRPEVKRA
jgi:hypothetical protein